MKIEITIKWGQATKIVSTVYNDWSVDQVNEAIRKTLDIFGFNQKENEKERPRGNV